MKNNPSLKPEGNLIRKFMIIGYTKAVTTVLNVMKYAVSLCSYNYPTKNSYQSTLRPTNSTQDSSVVHYQQPQNKKGGGSYV